MSLSLSGAGHSGVSGDMFLRTGDATTTQYFDDSNSGSLSIVTGSAAGGKGGDIDVRVGSGNFGNGGDIKLTGGSTSGRSALGGSLHFISGSSHDTSGQITVSLEDNSPRQNNLFNKRKTCDFA